MLRIDVYESALDDDQPHQFIKSIGATETQPDAVALIQNHITKHKHSGKNDDHIPPYWWCRNDGDDKRQILKIVGV